MTIEDGQARQHGSCAESTVDGVTRRGFVAGAGALAAGAATPGTAAGDRRGPLDQTQESDDQVPDDIERRVEELVRESLAEHDVPGASVAVVRDGTTTLAEGYGVADRQTGASATAETPFRLGSVAKPVVWTAVARLLRRDELDARQPVRGYIDDDIVSWDEPVTLAQLATHTAGFETTNRNMWYDDPASVRALSEHLDPMPAQVRSPGVVGSYSNHGVGLAGQVLASTHGRPFPKAMSELLLSPAGMETATFQQPLPKWLQEAHARGHDGDVDGKVAGLGVAPAGALSASATDMGRFMQLHLNDGSVDGSQVLDPETVELVQRQWFTHHEQLAGMALGFVEDEHGGVRLLRHAGATPLDVFWSELRLVPELGFGVFIAYNGEAREPLLSVADAVIEEVVPTDDSETPTPNGEPRRASDLDGTYRSLRHGTRAHDSLFTTINAATADVTVADDGALRVEQDGETSRWVETEPLVFRDEETGALFAFGERDSELYLFSSGSPTAMRKIPWYREAAIHLLVFLVSLIGVALGWFLWGPDREAGETRREWLRSLRSSRPRRAKFAVYVASNAFALFVIGFLWALNAGITGVFTEPRLAVRALFVLPILGAVSTAAAVASTPLIWRASDWQWRTRVHYTVVVCSLAAVSAFCWHWNLLVPP